MKKKIRIVFFIITVILTISFIGATNGAFTILSNDRPIDIQGKITDENKVEEKDIESVNEPVTVVSTQGFPTRIYNGELVAFTKSGDIVYYESDYGMYFDIYPVEDEKYTVRYLASERLYNQDCSSVKTQECTRSLYREVNMSTGESKTLYSEVTPHVSPTRWHDADNINETHIVVASILHDGVFIVNTENGEKNWVWNATEDYQRPTGKHLDWTHLNDVNVLEDGTLMVSLRNQDQVVFLEKKSNGEYELNESRTLGSDDNYKVLYEQHNPDYIPEDEGGPAILVGDSENNRIVEYQRNGSEWEKSFAWRDARMQWPRDADRLPNGNTLITDSNGERVMEISSDGDVVWSAFIGLPYEAERLGTGEESSGESHKKIQISKENDGFMSLVYESKDNLPRSLINGLLFVLPPWIHFLDLLLLLGLLATTLSWSVTELLIKIRRVAKS